MHCQVLFCRSSIVWMLLLLLICGCAGKIFTGTVATPRSAESTVQALRTTDRLYAVARIELVTAQGRYPIRAALVLQKPSYLRLEILPVIGSPDFYLTASPDRMNIFIPSRAEFYSGKPSAENLARFLPWPASIEEMVSILTGTCPALGQEPVFHQRFMEGNLSRTEMKKPSGPSQTIWMDENGHVKRLIRYSPDNREIYRVLFEDHLPGQALAQKITIRWADDVTSVSVNYSDLNIEKAADLSVFDLKVPDGVKIIDLN